MSCGGMDCAMGWQLPASAGDRGLRSLSKRCTTTHTISFTLSHSGYAVSCQPYCQLAGEIIYEGKMAIQRVGVVGCGLMGSGIAQVAAAAGFETVVREMSAELVDKGLKGIEKNLNRLAEKGTITEAMKGEIRGRLKGTTSIDDLKNCDLVIEAIIKSQFFKSSMEVVPFNRPRISPFIASVIVPFSAKRFRFFSMPLSPLSTNSALISRTTVSNPAAAATCAIPEPISPHPTTPTL